MNRPDIDHLTEAELIDLNHRVVERLKLIRQVYAHKAMLEFRIGDRVVFETQGNTSICGILTRYNKKSVTVITDDGHHWNVSPQLLRLADPKGKTEADRRADVSKTVLPFKKTSSSA